MTLTIPAVPTATIQMHNESRRVPRRLCSYFVGMDGRNSFFDRLSKEDKGVSTNENGNEGKIIDIGNGERFNGYQLWLVNRSSNHRYQHINRKNYQYS